MASVREINENKDVYVGVTLPLSRGRTGHFKQSQTIREQVYSNIKNLILTAKGERLGQPTFGCDINTILFEPIEESTADGIEESVREAISTWIPYVTIANVFVSLDEQDNNKILLTIEYSVDVEDPDAVETITFNFNVGI